MVLVLDGIRHVLAAPVFTVGSGAVNNLVVPGDLVRKIHFQILRDGDRYRLQGLNGVVEVNGKPVAECWLQPGDAIRVGSARLEVAATTAPRGETASAGALEVLLDGVIALLENPDKRRSAQDVLALGMRLMEADGGFLFACEEGGLTLLHSIPEDNDLYSNSAVQSALRSGNALIWSMSGEDGEVSPRSAEQKSIHSLLVSPLRDRASGGVHGLLYVHRRRSERPFSEGECALFDRISQVLGAVLSDSRAQLRQQRQLESLSSRGGEEILFACAAMQKLVGAAERAAHSAVPVLIAGEPGVGKRTLAGFIHRHSPRAGRPFAAVDCAAAPAWIESELFGKEKGADGSAARRGAFEQAEGGTLFLDGVEELPPAAQGKLIRVLETGQLRREGGSSEISVDVRVIAATSRDLEEAARTGKFREDLYYRLNVVQLRIPPLREREGDVLLIARHLLRRACDAMNMNLSSLTKAAEKALLRYRWPGNVRELGSRLQRALLASASRVIDVEALDLPESEEEYGLKPLKAAREEAENRAVQLALSKAQGNLTLAASFLGIDRKVLRDVMDRLGIRKEEYKPRSG